MFASQIIIYTSIMIVILIVIYTILTRTSHYKCTEWAEALYPNTSGIEDCKKELKLYNSLKDKGAAYLDPGEWGACKGTSCNKSGYQTRIQTCAHGNKKKCSGDLIKLEKRPCKQPVYASDNILSVLPFKKASNKSCNTKAGWSDWSEWSDTCHPVNLNDECGKDGEQIRTRLCNNPYPKLDINGQIKNECEVDTGTKLRVSLNNIKDDTSASWAKIKNSISKSDIKLAKENERQQLIVFSNRTWPPKIEGTGSSQYVNTLIERASKTCPRLCIPINGGVSNWTDWTLCNASNCNSKGYTSRSRTCTNPRPSEGGADCPEVLTETKDCAIPCQVHGKWNDPGQWGECSATKCGTSGTKTRTKTCNNPSPGRGGKTCEGSATETAACNALPCPIDGGWSDYEQWGACSATACGMKGQKTRTRTCDNPVPKHGGNTCVGSVTETAVCEAPPCLVDGRWSNYGEWSACSATECGTVGQHTRTRTCDNPTPLHGGITCEGSAIETRHQVQGRVM